MNIHAIKGFRLVLNEVPYKINILGDKDKVLYTFRFKTKDKAREAFNEMYLEYLQKKKKGSR